MSELSTPCSILSDRDVNIIEHKQRASTAEVFKNK
jgi:hypothetical protein